MIRFTMIGSADTFRCADSAGVTAFLRTGDAVLDRDVIVMLIEYSMPSQLWRPVRVDQAGLLEQFVIRRDFAPHSNAAVICFATNFSSAAGERCTSRQKQKRQLRDSGHHTQRR